MITINVHLADLPSLISLGTRVLHELSVIRNDQQRIIAMSEVTQAAVDHVAAATASLKSEISTDLGAVASKLAALQQEIADLRAAGSGATAEQVASLEASATEIEGDVKTMHDALNPDPAPAV